MLDPNGVRIAATNVGLSLSNAQVPFSWFSKKTQSVEILHNVSVTIPPASVTAILGGSGSGKTSLLNVLCGRSLGRRAIISGTVSYNGRPVQSFDSRSVGYVLQADFLTPHLTVRECLTYAAALRLAGREITAEVRREHVERVILELGLKECADTRIGNEHVRGISGGEKRRVSIAVQLLTNPAILFLDEPTSGLDAFAALSVSETLGKLAMAGRTVVLSIHQPRSDVFRVFNNLVLMSAGQVLYCGAASDAVAWFASVGYPCPRLDVTNPADHLIDLASLDDRTPEAHASTSARIHALHRLWASRTGATSTATAGATAQAPAPPAQSVYIIAAPPPTSAAAAPATAQGSAPPADWVYIIAAAPASSAAAAAAGAAGRACAADAEHTIAPVPSKLSADPLWSSSGAATDAHVLLGSPGEPASAAGQQQFGGRSDFVLHNTSTKQASVAVQVVVLTRRSATNLTRDSLTICGILIQNVLVGLILGGIFWQAAETLGGIRTRTAFMYSTIALQPYISMVFFIQKLATDMRVFDRERAQQLYSVLPYMVAELVAMLPINTVFPTVYTVIVYSMAGLHWSKFLIYCITYLASYWVIIALSWVAVGAFRDLPRSSLMANSIYTFMGLACGFFIVISALPVYVRWISHVSFVQYAFRLLTYNEFNGSVYACPYPDPATNPFCAPYWGSTVLTQFGFENTCVACSGVALLVFIVVFLVVAYLLLRFKSSSMYSAPPATARSTSTTIQAAPPALTTTAAMSLDSRVPNGASRAPGDGEKQPLATAVELHSVGMLLVKRDWLGRASAARRQVLTDVCAKFRPGRLTVILGPSGSGKSTLLNMIAQRINTGRRTAALQSGTITFNDSVASKSLVRRTVSYVLQSDSLLPCLTVRETLHFSARLRLPRHMAERHKIARAEAVLAEVGLNSCADTMVGGELMKGISGGEKRRVSIAAQLLTRPSVLLLDEPTTGLDSWSANHVVQTLKQLCGAPYQRTVVATLHQPRSDVFPLIDDLLIISKTGHVAYFGPAENALPFFAAAGQRCPSQTNPTDFLIDAVSVDLRTTTAETATRQRLNDILEHQRASRLFQSATSAGLAPPASPPLARTNSNRATVVPAIYTDCASSPCCAVSVVPVDAPYPPHEPLHSGEDKLAEPPKPKRSKQARTRRRPHAHHDTDGCSMAPMQVAVPLLIRRAAKNLLRQPQVAMSRIMQLVALGVIFALFFSPLSPSYEGITNRLGAVQELTAITFVGMLNNIAVFPDERNVFYREHADGAYSTESFILSYTAAELPFELISSLLFTILMTFAAGLRSSTPHFFILSTLVFLVTNAGESIGLMFCSLVYHIGFSVTLTSAALSMFSVLSGLMSTDPGVVLNAINYISVIKYMTRSEMQNEFVGRTFTCSAANTLPDGTCPISTGEQLLATFNLPSSNMGIYILITFFVALAYRLIGYLLLKASARYQT